MVSFKPSFSPIVLNNHISDKVACKFIGYSLQYLRRLLRTGKLAIKIGQVWMIELTTFKAYLETEATATDQRFGTH